MKKFRKLICLFLALTMSLVMLAGCNDDVNDEPTDLRTTEDPPQTPEPTQPTQPTVSRESDGFSYSDAFDENGYLNGTRALDYVEIFDYQAMLIPREVHSISDEAIQAEIVALLTEYPEALMQTRNRAVVDGDRVNIDYVGSVDGVEFEGGSTEGFGADVTAGSSEYIGDFLSQLIGHMPGDVINVEVTFPNDYFEETLRGRDALFVTIINYIIEAELTDEFVAENLFANYGWTTVAEMNEELRSALSALAIQNYLFDYFLTQVTLSSIPSLVVENIEKAMISYYQQGADIYEMELNEFLNMFAGFSSVGELIDAYYDQNLENAIYFLVLMAVGEDAGIFVTEEELLDYFRTPDGETEYYLFVEEYGVPYAKHIVLSQKITDFLIDNVILL